MLYQLENILEEEPPAILAIETGSQVLVKGPMVNFCDDSDAQFFLEPSINRNFTFCCGHKNNYIPSSGYAEKTERKETGKGNDKLLFYFQIRTPRKADKKELIRMSVIFFLQGHIVFMIAL